MRSQLAPRRMLSVTFDDLPFQFDPLESDPVPFRILCETNRKMLEMLIAYEIPAVGFVNEKRFYDYGKSADAFGILEEWLDAGLELGNHTFSHITPASLPLAEYCTDVILGERITRVLMKQRGKKLRYFRHPMLHTGSSLSYKTGLEIFLSNHGYTTAPVTIKHQDWIFSAVYTAAKVAGNESTMRLVSDAYLVHIERSFELYENLSVRLFGYEIRQILLLHVNELNSDFFDCIVRLIKTRGYRFISLEHALNDIAYLRPDVYVGPRGPSWLQRWAMADGLNFDDEEREPQFIRQLFEATFDDCRLQTLSN